MRRAIFVLAVCVVFFAFFCGVALAASDPIKKAAEEYATQGILQPGKENQLLRLLGSAMSYLADKICGLPGFFTIDELVFPRGEDAPEVGATFTKKEWEGISTWYSRTRFVSLCGSVAGLVFALLALRHALSASNAKARAESMEGFFSVVSAVLIIITALPLTSLLLELNRLGINLVAEWLGSSGLSWFEEQSSRGALDAVTVEGSMFLTGICRLIFAFVTLQLNFLYLVRKVVIAVSLVAMPLAAWSWVSRKTRLPVFLLGSEIATNAVMGLSHALVLGIIYELFFAKGSGAALLPGRACLAGTSMFETWWARMFVFCLLAPVSALLRRVVAGWLNFLGVDEEKWAAGATFGLGGLFTIGTAVSMMLGAGATATGALAAYAAPYVKWPSSGGDDKKGGPVPARLLGGLPGLSFERGAGTQYVVGTPSGAFLGPAGTEVTQEVLEGGRQADVVPIVGESSGKFYGPGGGQIPRHVLENPDHYRPKHSSAAPEGSAGGPSAGGGEEAAPPPDKGPPPPEKPARREDDAVYFRRPSPSFGWRAAEESLGAVGRAFGLVAGLGVPGAHKQLGYLGEQAFVLPVKGLRALAEGVSAFRPAERGSLDGPR